MTPGGGNQFWTSSASGNQFCTSTPGWAPPGCPAPPPGLAQSQALPPASQPSQHILQYINSVDSNGNDTSRHPPAGQLDLQQFSRDHQRDLFESVRGLAPPDWVAAAAAAAAEELPTLLVTRWGGVGGGAYWLCGGGRWGGYCGRPGSWVGWAVQLLTALPRLTAPLA